MTTEKIEKYRLEWSRYVHPFEVGAKASKNDEEVYNDDLNEFVENPVITLINNRGMVPVNRNALPNRCYNLWLANSNFKFPKYSIDILNHLVDGVEAWELLTPYQMLVGVAKLFDETEVKKNIKEEFVKYLEKNDKNEDVNIKNIYEFSVKSLDPETGLTIIISADSKEQLEEKIKKHIKQNPQNIIEE